jgi:hypothetical protein
METSQTVTDALATANADVIVGQKLIYMYMLLNPFIYNKRSVVVFHIFNPTGIALTAFSLLLQFIKAKTNFLMK